MLYCMYDNSRSGTYYHIHPYNWYNILPDKSHNMYHTLQQAYPI